MKNPSSVMRREGTRASLQFLVHPIESFFEEEFLEFSKNKTDY